VLSRLLAGTDLKQLATFASPAFFEVLPPVQLFRRARELRARSKDAEAMRHTLGRRRAALAAAGLPIDLGARPEGRTPGELADDRRAALVVELYFHQLFGRDPVLLDLRAQSFTPARGRLSWHPASWIADFSPEFAEALQQIYLGFYRGDDGQFRGGLKQLNLLDAEDVFREQFGTDAHAVTFRTKHFVSTFHEVFLRCKRSGKSLHPDFLPLGIYLAALYDHLEPLGVSVDVARCFETATKERAA
jgi:hypothetical protein